jgi:hypothetical protein
MTADVYAGDEDLNLARPQAALSGLAIIRLRADADPDVLFRIAAQLNFLNCAPARFTLEQGSEGQVVAEIHVRECSEFSIDMACRKLERLTCVFEVARENSP